MARGLLTPRPTMVESDTPATVDSAILVMEDTMARGLLTPRPTMVESDTPAMADSAVLDTDTLDKLQILKYCGELQTLKLLTPQKEDLIGTRFYTESELKLFYRLAFQNCTIS